MSSKILIIYEYQTLFEILNEIKENLNFKVIQSNKEDFKSLKLDSNSNCIILSSKKHKYIKDCIVHNNPPLKLEKIIELVNIHFLKNKFSDQSSLKIGKYLLDLNSRKISLSNKSLALTEREINLIVFINQKGNVGIKDLQKKVWDYSDDSETHTVETHIYRLRKKMKESFGDTKFISHNNDGYFIDLI